MAPGQFTERRHPLQGGLKASLRAARLAEDALVQVGERAASRRMFGPPAPAESAFMVSRWSQA